MLRNGLILLLLVVCSTLQGCSALSSTPAQQYTNITLQTLGYPAPDVVSPYKNPEPQEDLGYPNPRPNNNLNGIPFVDVPSVVDNPLVPQDGFASIAGTIYSFTSNIQVADTKVFLTRALGEENSAPPLLLAPNPDIGDILGRTEANGQFRINDVPPGNYYIILWAPNGASIIVNNINGAYSPQLFTITQNKQYQLGALLVSWP